MSKATYIAKQGHYVSKVTFYLLQLLCILQMQSESANHQFGFVCSFCLSFHSPPKKNFLALFLLLGNVLPGKANQN